jgi:hypothetical protein
MWFCLSGMYVINLKPFGLSHSDILVIQAKFSRYSRIDGRHGRQC